MVALVRTISIQAFHYIPADSVDLQDRDEVFVQKERLDREVPALNVYDATVEPEPIKDLFEDEEAPSILTVIQRHYVAGERSNIEHKLRPEDWLVQDHMVEGGWRVLTPAQLHKFLKG
jgi:hypothetical protein